MVFMNVIKLHNLCIMMKSKVYHLMRNWSNYLKYSQIFIKYNHIIIKYNFWYRHHQFRTILILRRSTSHQLFFFFFKFLKWMHNCNNNIYPKKSNINIFHGGSIFLAIYTVRFISLFAPSKNTKITQKSIEKPMEY